MPCLLHRENDPRPGSRHRHRCRSVKDQQPVLMPCTNPKPIDGFRIFFFLSPPSSLIRLPAKRDRIRHRGFRPVTPNRQERTSIQSGYQEMNCDRHPHGLTRYRSRLRGPPALADGSPSCCVICRRARPGSHGLPPPIPVTHAGVVLQPGTRFQLTSGLEEPLSDCAAPKERAPESRSRSHHTHGAATM